MKKNVLLVIALLVIFAGLTFAAEDFKIRKLDNGSQTPAYAEGEIVVVTDLMAVRITRLLEKPRPEDEET